jgi:hypothetical protein
MLERRSFIGLLFVVFSLTLLNTTVQATVSDYTAYWELDNRDDSSVNGYHFTTGNYVRPDGEGVAGGSAGFSNTTTYTDDTRSVEINAVPKIRDVGSQFTLSMWFKPRDLKTTGAGYEALFDYYHTATNDRAISVMWHNGTGHAYAFLSEDGAISDYGHSGTQQATADNTWHHLAVVGNLDGDDGSVDDLEIYLTPITAGSINPSQAWGLSLNSIHNYSGPDGVVKLAVGSSGENFLTTQVTRTLYGSWGDGLIDEVAFYNRSLAQAEVSQLFDLGQSGEAIPIPEPATLFILSAGICSLVCRKKVK